MTDEVEQFEEWLASLVERLGVEDDGYRAELRSWCEDEWMRSRRDGTPLPTFGFPTRAVGPPEDDDVGAVEFVYDDVEDPVAEAERRAAELERQHAAEAVVRRAEQLPDVPSSLTAMPAAWTELSCHIPDITTRTDLPGGFFRAYSYAESPAQLRSPAWELELVDRLSRREKQL